MSKKIYEVKSLRGHFNQFEIVDNELGYLDFNIHNHIAELIWGPIGKIIGARVSTSDFRVRAKGTKRWKQIEYKENSSESYLK